MTNRKWMRVLLVLTVSVLSILLAACSSPEKAASTKQETVQEPADWAIYWYLCGSDLESKHGAASADLDEMLKIKLPENVKVVIETGGATKWKNKSVKEDELCRFVYDHKGLKKVDKKELANMGDGNTLSDFLTFCTTSHPAKNSMLILWNHGGGVLGGVAYDEVYGLDSLSMKELQSAFETSFPNTAEPVFDIIGFDACLMANLDTAHVISPYASYMIASQEWEPGNGWNYTGILDALTKETVMEPEKLGTVVCDTFMDGCIQYGTEAESTLSLLNLETVKTLYEQFCLYGDELFIQSLEDEATFAVLGRAANNAEDYGGNSKEEGYTNMVDMGGFLKANTMAATETNEKLQELLEECVVYQVRGPYRAYGDGLSCYYPYDNALNNLFNYKESSSCEGYGNLYHYQISGKLGGALIEYLEKKGLTQSEEGKELITIDKLGLANFPIMVTGDGMMILELGNKAHYLKQVGGYLACVDFANSRMLGVGNELIEDANWESGTFNYPYRTEWWYMDGHLIYTFFQEDREEYNLYSTPILLNGERVFLKFAENADGRVEILGARKELAENGMADKQVIMLKPGDEVTTLFYQSGLDLENMSLGLKEYETFVIGDQVNVKKDRLADGIYIWTYDMTDMWNNYATSDLVMYEVTEGTAKRF